MFLRSARHIAIPGISTNELNMKPVRRFASVSLLTTTLLVSGYSATAARGNDAMANLDAFITKALHEYQVPGAAVAVVQDGKLALLKGYGVRDATKPGAVDENTIFQLASVTKTLTYRVPLNFAAIPETDIKEACERFNMALETWTRQEHAFGLLKKVYGRRAKLRGEQPLNATANIIPWP